jgi:hypothetical protein
MILGCREINVFVVQYLPLLDCRLNLRHDGFNISTSSNGQSIFAYLSHNCVAAMLSRFSFANGILVVYSLGLRVFMTQVSTSSVIRAPICHTRTEMTNQ